MWGQHILALLFLLLAVFAISQIFRLIRQRHSLVGFHFAFLALSLITCVFHAVDMICFTSTLSPMAFFFTSLFPLCPQLSTYSLLIIFIMSVTDKTRWRVWGRAVVLGWLGFIITVLAFICFLFVSVCKLESQCSRNNTMWNLMYCVVYFIVAFTLMVVGCRLAVMARLKGDSISPEFRKRSWTHVLAMVTIISLIFFSRAVYNLAVITGGWWKQRGEKLGVSSVALLAIWDIIPTSVVLIFFRIPSIVPSTIEFRESQPESFVDTTKRYSSDSFRQTLRSMPILETLQIPDGISEPASARYGSIDYGSIPTRMSSPFPRNSRLSYPSVLVSSSDPDAYLAQIIRERSGNDDDPS